MATLQNKTTLTFLTRESDGRQATSPTTSLSFHPRHHQPGSTPLSTTVTPSEECHLITIAAGTVGACCMILPSVFLPVADFACGMAREHFSVGFTL